MADYKETLAYQKLQARKARRLEKEAEERLARFEKRKPYSETRIDKALKTCVEEAGGFITKMHPTTNAGMPDRLVHFRGTTYYVELKATGKECTDLQIEMHKRLRSHGIQVYVLDTLIKDYWELFQACYTTYEGSHYYKNPHKKKND